MFEKYDDTKKILIEIVELLGFLAIGITFWELTKNVLIIIIYVLLIFIILLFLRYEAIRRELVKFQQNFNTIVQDAEQKKRFQGYYNGMLGSFFYATEQPINDTKHHFTYAQEEYIVHKDDGTYIWTLKGFNTLDEPSSKLTIKFAGESPADVSSLALSVTDMATEERYNDYQIKVIKDLPYLKVFDLIFPKPLAKNECFDLKISCKWDKNFPRSKKHDYVFFGSGNYASKGIDKFIGRLVCDLSITEFVIERLDSGELIKEHR